MTALQTLGAAFVAASGFLLFLVWKKNENEIGTRVLGTLFYGFFLVAGLSLLAGNHQKTESPPSAPATDVDTQPEGGGFQPGYENPAPGDDGSDDCAPGQAPVAVAPGDPSNLDADGDGIGCE